MRFPRVGAARRSGSGGAAGRGAPPLHPAAERPWVSLRRGAGTARGPVRLPPGWRAAAPRSGLFLSAAGSGWAVLGDGFLLPLERRSVEGRPARTLRLLRAARRDLHARGDLRCRHPAPAAAGRSGSDRGGTDAGRPVPRLAQLGLRRGRSLRRPELLRRARKPEAPGRCLPRRRTGRGARRGLQPPRAGGQLPEGVRPVLHRSLPHALGGCRQPRRTRQRRGPALLRGERAPLDHRVPLRRPAPRRGTRHGRSLRPPLSGRVDRDAPGRGRLPRPDGARRGRERLERRAPDPPPAGGRPRHGRPVERRLSPLRCTHF